MVKLLPVLANNGHSGGNIFMWLTADIDVDNQHLSVIQVFDEDGYEVRSPAEIGARVVHVFDPPACVPIQNYAEAIQTKTEAGHKCDKKGDRDRIVPVFLKSYSGVRMLHYMVVHYNMAYFFDVFGNSRNSLYDYEASLSDIAVAVREFDDGTVLEYIDRLEHVLVGDT